MVNTKTIQLLAVSFIGLVVVLAVVLVALSGGWEDPDDELAQLGIMVAGVAGLAGLGAVLWWRNRSTSTPQRPTRFATGFLITTAIAEVGMLLGFVFAMGSQRLSPFWVGAALFVLSLAILTTAIGQIEFEA